MSLYLVTLSSFSFLGAFVLADDFIIKELKQQALPHSHSSSHTLHWIHIVCICMFINVCLCLLCLLIYSSICLFAN